MVSLKKINLVKLEKDNLTDQEMRCLKGGSNCDCGCHYAYSGGSSRGVNDSANFDNGYTSYGGGEESCACSFAKNHVTDSEFWSH